MRQHLPNAVTLLNVILGCCALVCLFNQEFVAAVWFLVAAVAADYADGMLARALNVQSPLGKELDSLADMVSFGVVPAAMLYQMLLLSWDLPTDAFAWQATPAFLLAAFSCLRLARFNLDTRQTDHFIGLPTPSSTALVAGVLLWVEFNSFGLRAWILQPWLLYALTLVVSGLLVSEIPMFSLKFKSLRWKGNEFRLSAAAVALVLLVWLQEAAPALIVSLYILVSAALHWGRRKR